MLFEVAAYAFVRCTDSLAADRMLAQVANRIQRDQRSLMLAGAPANRGQEIRLRLLGVECNAYEVTTQ